MKNFTVIAKKVKNGASGLSTFTNYLQSANHRNHKERTKVISLLNEKNNGSSFVGEMSSIMASRDLANVKAGKGGRPIQNLALSLCFSLPSDVPKPTVEQWKSIFRDIYNESKDFLKRTSPDLKSYKIPVFANVHEQENPHLNVCLGMFNETDSLRNLSRPSFINQMKQTFNKSVKLHLGVDVLLYKPKNINSNFHQKFRLPTEYHNKKQAELALKQASILLNEANLKEIENNLVTEENIKIRKKLAEEKDKIFKITENFKNSFAKQISNFVLDKGKHPEVRADNAIKRMNELIKEEGLTDVFEVDMSFYESINKTIENANENKPAGRKIKNRLGKP